MEGAGAQAHRPHLLGEGQGAWSSMAKVDGNAPMRDSGTLKDVLKRIDNVMEWRFVNALGRGRPRRGHPRGEHRLRGPAHHALLRGGISQANRGAGSGGEKR